MDDVTLTISCPSCQVYLTLALEGGRGKVPPHRDPPCAEVGTRVRLGDTAEYLSRDGWHNASYRMDPETARRIVEEASRCARGNPNPTSRRLDYQPTGWKRRFPRPK